MEKLLVKKIKSLATLKALKKIVFLSYGKQLKVNETVKCYFERWIINTTFEPKRFREFQNYLEIQQEEMVIFN
jgi:hypothetical protein